MTTALLVTLSSTGTTETIPGDRPAIGASALRALWGRTFRGEECPEEIHDVDPSGDSGIPAFLADVADRAVTLSTVAVGGTGYVLLPGGGVDGCDCWALATITEAPAEAPADESTYSVTFIGAETREAYDATEGADGSDALTLAEVIGRCESYAVRAQLRDAAGFSKGFVSADGTYTLT